MSDLILRVQPRIKPVIYFLWSFLGHLHGRLESGVIKSIEVKQKPFRLHVRWVWVITKIKKLKHNVMQLNHNVMLVDSLS